MLEKLKVKDVMSRQIITTHPQEDVILAFEKLMKHRISSLPVIDEGKLVGIVTSSDLGHNLILDKYELGTTVEEVMIKEVITINPEDDLLYAIEKMKEYARDQGILNQLVVVHEGKIEGIISDGDIIRSLTL